jgi:hypothetical protein
MATDYSMNISQDIPVSTPNFALADRSNLIKQVGGTLLDAYTGYKESEFEGKLEQEVGTLTGAQQTIFDQTNRAAEDRGVGEDVAIRTLLNTGDDVSFKKDREALQSKFQSELSRVKEAAEQLPQMRDQMFTRASALLRQYIAATPGLADRYRAIAARTVGVDNLYTYQLDKLYGQISSIERQQQQQAAEGAKAAQEEHKQQFEYIQKNNPDLDPASINGMLKDPVLGAQIADQSRNNAKAKLLREQSEQAFQAIERGSKVNAGQASNLVMAGFTAGAFDVVNALTQQSFKNRPELMKYVDNPNGAPPEFFAKLAEGSIVAKQQLNLAYQQALTRAEQLIVSQSILPGEADGIRNRLKSQFENADKMLDSSGGALALFKQLQAGSKLRVDEQAVQLSNLTNLANLYGFTGQVLQAAQSNPSKWFNDNIKNNPALASFGRAYMDELRANPFVGEAMQRYMNNPMPEAGVLDSDKGPKVAANAIGKVAAQDFLSKVAVDPTAQVTPQDFVKHAGNIVKMGIEGFDDGMEVAMRALSPSGIISASGKKAGPQAMEEFKNLVTQQVDYTLMNESDTSRTGMLKKRLAEQVESLNVRPEMSVGPSGRLQLSFKYGSQAGENAGKVSPYTDSRAARQVELIDNTLMLKSLATGTPVAQLRKEYLDFFVNGKKQDSVDATGAKLEDALKKGTKLPAGQSMASTPEERDVNAILVKQMDVVKRALATVQKGTPEYERLAADVDAIEAEIRRGK